MENRGLQALKAHPWRTGGGLAVSGYLAATQLWASLSVKPFLPTVGSIFSTSGANVATWVGRVALGAVLVLIVVLQVLLLRGRGVPPKEPVTTTGEPLSASGEPVALDPGIAAANKEMERRNAQTPKQNVIEDLFGLHHEAAGILLALQTDPDDEGRQDRVIALKKRAVDWCFRSYRRISEYDLSFSRIPSWAAGLYDESCGTNRDAIADLLSQQMDALKESIQAIQSGNPQRGTGL